MNADIEAARNAFNPFHAEVESLKDLQNVRLPEDATLQRWYLDALKRQAELLQAQLNTALRYIDQAQSNLEKN